MTETCEHQSVVQLLPDTKNDETSKPRGEVTDLCSALLPPQLRAHDRWWPLTGCGESLADCVPRLCCVNNAEEEHQLQYSRHVFFHPVWTGMWLRIGFRIYAWGVVCVCVCVCGHLCVCVDLCLKQSAPACWCPEREELFKIFHEFTTKQIREHQSRLSSFCKLLHHSSSSDNHHVSSSNWALLQDSSH